MLREHLDVFVVAYLDNVLIYSKSVKEHKQHVKQVLDIFKQNSVKLVLHKAKWF